MISVRNEISSDNPENELKQESKKQIQQNIEDKAVSDGLSDKELVSLMEIIGRKVTYKTVNKWRNGKSNPSKTIVYGV